MSQKKKQARQIFIMPPRKKKVKLCVDMTRHGTPAEQRKYASRPSPPFPANACCGQRMQTGDGQWWVSEKRGKSKACSWYPEKSATAPVKAAVRGRASTTTATTTTAATSSGLAGKKRPRSRSTTGVSSNGAGTGTKTGAGTKATFANALTCDEIRAAFVQYQKADAAWAVRGECERRKAALVRKAKRETLAQAYMDKTGGAAAQPATAAATHKAKKAKKAPACSKLATADLCKSNDQCIFDRIKKRCVSQSQIARKIKTVFAALKRQNPDWNVFLLVPDEQMHADAGRHVQMASAIIARDSVPFVFADDKKYSVIKSLAEEAFVVSLPLSYDQLRMKLQKSRAVDTHKLEIVTEKDLA